MKRVEELNLEGLRVLDGGMATELERKGCKLDGPLWSAQVLESAPEVIAQVHREYLEAGADCLVTASYQVSEEGFRELGRATAGAARAAADALRSAVAIAEGVRRGYQANKPRKIWIAAGLGPYGAALHNGAEYHGNYDCSFEDLISFHSRRLAVLQHTNADFAAFETIPSAEEAQAIVAALSQFPSLGACVSFTCRDAKHIAHGEDLRDPAKTLDGSAQVIAIGVNCTHPKFVLPLTRELASVTRKPIAVYPNSGEDWDAERRRWTGKGETAAFGEMALEWREAGAQWIGGCCRTGPKEIKAVAEALRI
jgi:homocysteine S-methyltransferase